MGTNLVIPVGGLGQRFSAKGWTEPKPLISINGKPMLLASVESLGLAVENYLFAIRKFEGFEDLCVIIKKNIPKAKFYLFDKVTEGPAITVANTLSYFDVDLNEKLYTANCDQIMRWNGITFQFATERCDGMVVTFEGGTNAHSYVELNKFGKAIRFTEKIKISNTALTGIHYWNKAVDFIDSVEEMVRANDRAPNGEFYIAPSYNYMIKEGKNIGIYHIPRSMFCPVGTPEELESYLSGDS